MWADRNLKAEWRMPSVFWNKEARLSAEGSGAEETPESLG